MRDESGVRPRPVLAIGDDGRTWWDTREDSSLLCAVGRKWISVEDTKAAVRRFTQALDSNTISRYCLRFVRRPALIRGARELTLTLERPSH